MSDETERSGPGALRTKHGFMLDETVSALQKSIRRGEEVDAMFWSLELDASGMANYAFKRLAIISCEDIGPADPQAIVVVNSCWSAWERIKKAGGRDAYPAHELRSRPGPGQVSGAAGLRPFCQRHLQAR